jgi:hypothetical protein
VTVGQKLLEYMLEKHGNMKNNLIPNIQKIGNFSFDSNKLQEVSPYYIESFLPNYKGKDKILSSSDLSVNFGKNKGLVVRNQDGSYKLFNSDDYLPNAPITSKSETKKEIPQWIKDRTTKGTDTVNFYETLNYKNWGLKDYSDYTTRGSAFRNARTNGEKEFMYKGTRYNTNYAGTPKQQLKETGITNEQLQDRSNLNKKLTKNIYPYGYDIPFHALFNMKDPNRELVDNVLKNKIGVAEQRVINATKNELNVSDDRVKKLVSNRIDALNMYAGIPQKNNTFSISNQIPSKSKEKNKIYYTFNNENKNELEKSLINWSNTSIDKKTVLTDKENTVMGDYTVSKGKDKRGEYVSYYDKWDLDPMGSTLSPADFGKPFEMYDRMYTRKQGDKYVKMNYTDEELSKLNPNSKNFDVKALQEELSTRGYDMWTSRNKTGFDGIYGNDTKKALLDYQSKNKKMYGGKLLPSINKF